LFFTAPHCRAFRYQRVTLQHDHEVLQVALQASGSYRSRLSLRLPGNSRTLKAAAFAYSLAEDDEESARSTKARPKFRGLSETEALREIEIENSAAGAEVTRLVAAYYCKFKAALHDQGLAAAPAIMADVSCPIEKVAVFTLLTFVEKEFLTKRPDSWN